MSGPAPEAPQPAPAHRNGRFSLVEVLIGLTLLAVGIIWLLQATDVLDVSWYAVLAAALVAVGVVLMIGSASGEHGGLIAIGVILTVVLTGASWADLRFEGGVGPREIVPMSIEALDSPYRHTAGPMTIDLRQMEFPEGETTVEGRVGAGELIVIVPQDLPVKVDWRVVAGNVTIFENEQSGLFLDDSEVTPGFGDASARLRLDLIVTTGTIEVRR